MFATRHHGSCRHDRVGADPGPAQDDRVGRTEHVSAQHDFIGMHGLIHEPGIRTVVGVVGVRDRHALRKPRVVADGDGAVAMHRRVASADRPVAHPQLALGLQLAPVPDLRARADPDDAAPGLEPHAGLKHRAVAKLDETVDPVGKVENALAPDRDVAPDAQRERARPRPRLQPQRPAQARRAVRLDDEPAAEPPQAGCRHEPEAAPVKAADHARED